MHILVVGLNHKTAPVELRERLSFDGERLELALRTLHGMKSVLECVIVSTCNRMELYAVCDQLHTGKYYAKSFLETWFRLPREEFSPHLYVKSGDEAIRHLHRVVCGLDSLVIGETQILGQVKDAFLAAQRAKVTGTIFNMLFKQAVTFGKRVHSETEIGQNAVSVSYAAVELGRKMFDTLEGKTVLLVGAGKMSELTARHFRSVGAGKVLVVNRTFERARELADRFSGEARPWEHLSDSLREADIVVSSTGAREPVLTFGLVSEAVKNRRRPLFLIDIAVPRDIVPTVHELDQVFLYDIDDLQGIVDSNLALREQEGRRVETWIEGELAAFRDWMDTLGVVPLISALREKMLAIQEEAVQRIERKLPELTEQEKRVIRKHTRGIVNQLLHDPIVRIKELATTSKKAEAQEMFVYLFALEDTMEKNGSGEEKETSAKQPRWIPAGAAVRQ
ncbi:glutamyl-tRNA reductase [Staphylospora marina]|uniref:glutamyl-tRNA reductase n=1 Tax=Staphylospora marina TaxID=2490858 RepID=UPI000F5BCA9F|nr:glutamyl-tRNA reductase [Staphylospora marina]